MRLLFVSLLFIGCAQAGEPSAIRENYELLSGCSVAYARKHANSRLTATEMAAAAVASCDEYAWKLRDAAYNSMLSQATAHLTARQKQRFSADLQNEAHSRAESIRADSIERAKTVVLRFLAENHDES